uniref:GIY-YIG domain-containing protein n=1 Tax=Cuerna arida TaxID=1464854 RepID=A0A1B6G949_9HEMI
MSDMSDRGVQRVKNDKSKKLKFDIFRKPTHTDRYIMNDSHHPPAQKRAVFNSLIFRLLNTPLSEERSKKELNYIRNVAIFNGFDKSLVDNMYKKAKRKQEKNSKTTLVPIQDKNTKWICTTWTNISRNVQKTIKKHTNMNITYKTRNNLKHKLKTPKDSIDNQDKSGIYQIDCEDCSKTYIGQTKRKIITRFKEHCSHIKYNREEKSAVANHCLNSGHSISKQNLKLQKQVTTPKFLNAWESYFINHANSDNLLNQEDGPIQNSILLSTKLLK